MTLDEFVVMFPEFVDREATLLNDALIRALRDVDDSWFEGDRARAQGLLAAHYIVSSEETSDIGSSGAIASEHIGEISRSYARGSSGNGSPNGYWSEFAELRRKNHPPIMVI